MNKQTNETLSAESLWLGGLIGIISTIFTKTGFETTTFVLSLLALLVSIPVYIERQKISNVFEGRAIHVKVRKD